MSDPAPLPPQNLDAEESLLGAILLAGVEGTEASASVLSAVRASGLRAEDFYRPSHALIYRAALAVADRDEPTDVLALEQELRDRGQLRDSGGKERLQELAMLALATTNAGHYAALVVEAAERREQSEVALALREHAENGGLRTSPELRERVARLLEERRLGEGERVEFVTFEQFVSRPEPQAEPLVLDAESGTVLSATGLGMVYGTGGAGKTTLFLDAALHFAAGLDWLDGNLRPARRLRVAWIENEGPREEFRRKLERKLSDWSSRVERDRLRVLDRPWSEYDLRRSEHRAALAREIGEAEVDLLVVGPLHRLGMEGGGTPDEVRAFVRLVEDVQRRAGRPVFFLIVHHDNRAGQVSGAWEGVPDLLVHVTPQGNGRTRVFWQKARWSSVLHATALALTWTDGESFAVEEKSELEDADIAEAIVNALAVDPGMTWSAVIEQTPGMSRKRRADVRDQLLSARRILNVTKDERGERVALDHVPPKRQASLYPSDDPTIRHLIPERGSEGDQIDPLGGEGEQEELIPGPRPIGGPGSADQSITPPSDSWDIPFTDDDADYWAERARAVESEDHEGSA